MPITLNQFHRESQYIYERLAVAVSLPQHSKANHTFNWATLDKGKVPGRSIPDFLGAYAIVATAHANLLWIIIKNLRVARKVNTFQFMC